MLTIPVNTDTQLHFMELTPTHYDNATCDLCGQHGVNVDWYWGNSPESYNTYVAINTAFKNIREWPDDTWDLNVWPNGGATLHLAVQDLIEKIDPIGLEHDIDGGEMRVCHACAFADRPELRRRIRAYADQLDEAGYSALYGPDSDDLADPTLRDLGIWVRRHIGYELVIDEVPV